jgi:hypothetical protein
MWDNLDLMGTRGWEGSLLVLLQKPAIFDTFMSGVLRSIGRWVFLLFSILATDLGLSLGRVIATIPF